MDAQEYIAFLKSMNKGKTDAEIETLFFQRSAERAALSAPAVAPQRYDAEHWENAFAELEKRTADALAALQAAAEGGADGAADDDAENAENNPKNT